MEKRIPFSGTLELTRNCNLNCLHCYHGEQKTGRSERPELTIGQWLSIIDDIAAQGCLYLLITGGEPLMVRDFQKIYTYAKRKGLIVSVFTNGTLVTDDIASLFSEYPPQEVEITLYGAKMETYEQITGVKGSYDKCMAGIRRLLDNGIHVKLKTILSTLNRRELKAMEDMAESYGVKFRFDAALIPCFNGDQTPVDLRIPPQEAVEEEFSNKDRYLQWQDYYQQMKHETFSDIMYSCGAGLASFHIDATGRLTPCLMIDDISFDLTEGDFLTGWQHVIPSVRTRKIPDTLSCKTCDKRVLCGYCPAFFKLENGVEDKCSEYLCTMGQFRYKGLEQRKSCKEG